jgi:hypothetical protein
MSATCGTLEMQAACRGRSPIWRPCGIQLWGASRKATAIFIASHHVENILGRRGCPNRAGDAPWPHAPPLPAPGAQIGGLFGMGSFYIIYTILQLYYRRVMSTSNRSHNVLAERENNFSLVDENERTRLVFVHLIPSMDSFPIFTGVIYDCKDPQSAGVSGVSCRRRVQCTRKQRARFLVHCTFDPKLTPLIAAFLFTL